MAELVIYTSEICPYCIKAKRLLDSKEVTYREICVDGSNELASEALLKSGGKKTVPQIFIDDHHIGGCDELYALDQQGRLDRLLNS
ncbi:MAG: glutaredoxin 3 [Thermodesulfobacteriota bacterium]|nr:glutaredoxin 3 [Thermodesulfobacteriota bacterium]